MDPYLAFALRLVIATLLGGLIGLQRELSGKPAGLRTNLLICLGAALITQISLALPAALGAGDPARIAAQIVSGIGFLGAGTIMRSRHAVHGLTSAATIWVVAAVGLAVGAGFERQAAMGTALILIALTVLGSVEKRLLGQETVTMTLAFTDSAPDPQQLLARGRVRRRVLRSQWTSSPGGVSRLEVSWRGAAADIATVREVAARTPGLTVVGWEIEE